MGNAPILSALSFVIGAIISFYALVPALRFVMQLVRAPYYNPLAQLVVKLSDPILIPMRRVIPSIGRYDTSSLLMLFGVLFFKIAIFKLLSLGLVPVFGTGLNANVITLPQMLIAAVIDVVYLLFNVFIFALIIRAIMSWIPAMQGNPVQDLLAAITDPVLKPIRGFLPPMGGLDLSVFFTIVLLFAARIIVIGYAQALL